MAESSAAPVLSTPATHMFEEGQQVPTDLPQTKSEEQLLIKYEIQRTAKEIKAAQYKRVALQFPDQMLPDAARISDLLDRRMPVQQSPHSQDSVQKTRFYILGDTSYGACCVDEVAAEHVDADLVIHYGRSCLSPTAKLPVIHVFTKQPLHADESALASAVRRAFPNTDEKLILMADVTFQYVLSALFQSMKSAGYVNLHCADIEYNPSSPLPNRTVPSAVKADNSELKEWHVFHLSEPPNSLLLTLFSRVASIHIHSTDSTGHEQATAPCSMLTSRLLNRRYALLTSVHTVPIFGILINTLSVKNFLHIVEHVKSQISAAGKKSYTFVVGKLNAAKIANFSEIGAWVVIGCWESSLVESRDFWKPIVTPFELELALQGDEERTWNGEWTSDFQSVLDSPARTGPYHEDRESSHGQRVNDSNEAATDSEPESAPPTFDLRSGKYVSDSRPMSKALTSEPNGVRANTELVQRQKGSLAMIGGTFSPGAQYLHSQRTWKGLGSDDDMAEQPEGASIEEGRSGVARGYSHEISNSRKKMN